MYAAWFLGGFPTLDLQAEHNLEFLLKQGLNYSGYPVLVAGFFIITEGRGRFSLAVGIR